MRHDAPDRPGQRQSSRFPERDEHINRDGGDWPGSGRVLVIASDLGIKTVAATVVTIEGCEARTASPGWPAEQLISTWHPEVILVEVEGTSWQAQRQVRAYRDRAAGPLTIILLTQETLSDEELQSFDALTALRIP